MKNWAVAEGVRVVGAGHGDRAPLFFRPLAASFSIGAWVPSGSCLDDAAALDHAKFLITRWKMVLS